MTRTPNNLQPRKNPSEERLRATPFKSVADLEAEAEAIRLNVWRRFNEARVIRELLTKQEYKFMLEEWQEGLAASFDDAGAVKMFRIFSDGAGLKLHLNKEFTSTLGEQEVRFFEGVVRAGIEGFGALYMRGKGILAADAGTLDRGGSGPRKPQGKKKTSPTRAPR